MCVHIIICNVLLFFSRQIFFDVENPFSRSISSLQFSHNISPIRPSISTGCQKLPAASFLSDTHSEYSPRKYSCTKTLILSAGDSR